MPPPRKLGGQAKPPSKLADGKLAGGAGGTVDAAGKAVSGGAPRAKVCYYSERIYCVLNLALISTITLRSYFKIESEQLLY